MYCKLLKNGIVRGEFCKFLQKKEEFEKKISENEKESLVKIVVFNVRNNFQVLNSK